MMPHQLGHIEVELRAVERKSGFDILSEAQKNCAVAHRRCAVQIICECKCHVVSEEYPLLRDANVCQKAICHRFSSEDVGATSYRSKKVSIANNAVRQE